MTKKDYEVIARVIRETAREEYYIGAGRMFASKLSIAFMKDNPRFKPEVFMKACGY